MKNILITILLISATWSCRTATRTIDKERESFDSLFIEKKDIEIKQDSSYFTLSEISTTNSLLNLLSALNVNYNGSNSDSLIISINQTKSSLDVKIKGKAQANFNANAHNKSESKYSTIQKSVEFLQNIKINSDVKNQSKFDKSKTNKESEVKSKSVPFWIYLFGFLLLALIVALYWFFGRPKE